MEGRQIDRHTQDGQTDTGTGRQIYIQSGKETLTGTQTNIQTCRETEDRHKDSQRDKQKKRFRRRKQTGGQTDT